MKAVSKANEAPNDYQLILRWATFISTALYASASKTVKIEIKTIEKVAIL